jgi:hypothetical protein
VIQRAGCILSNYARAGKTLAMRSVRLAEAGPRKLAVRMHHLRRATVDDTIRVVKRAGLRQPSMDRGLAKVVDRCFVPQWCPCGRVIDAFF